MAGVRLYISVKISAEPMGVLTVLPWQDASA